MTDLPVEETWSPEPVKAWRYFWVGPLTWNWADDRWEVMLRGDVEEWTGPVKYAGQHTDPDYSITGGIDHSAPHLDCVCGVNAVKKLDSHEISHRVGMWCSCRLSPNTEDYNTIAVSPVELAGIVDEYEKGYRAQQATIVGPLTLITGTPKMAEVLSKNYGIEVTLDWYPMFRHLQIEEQREADNGHRKADTSDHRGTGTSQDTGTRKGTRHYTLKRVALATVTSVSYLSGAHLLMNTDGWWQLGWLGAVIAGTFLIDAQAKLASRNR